MQEQEQPTEGVRTEKLQALLDANEDPILLIDAAGVVLGANRAASALFGDAPHAQPMGMLISEAAARHPGLFDETRIEEAKGSRLPMQFEAEDEGAYFEVRFYPILDDEGSVREIAIYAHNVALRKQMETALRETEEKYRDIYENATEGIFQINLEGQFLSANPALARIHGYDSPEELMTTVTDISKQLYADPARRREIISLLGRYGRVQNFEAESLRKDGSTHWISINARLVRDAEGKPLYHEGTMRDITKRKEAEEALLESEEHYRTAVEHSNDGLAIIYGGSHEYVNRRFVEMFEYSTPEEILGTPITLVVHPDDRERVASINDQRQRGEPAPRRYEFKGLTKTGGIIHVEVSATNMTYRGKPVSFVYVRDITERKWAEEALIASRNELERLNRAKSKAVNHISHELKTPLALVRASIKILRQRLKDAEAWDNMRKIFHMLERNVDRLFEISNETDEIFKASLDLEASGLSDDIGRLEQRMEGLSEVPEEMRLHTQAIREWVDGHISGVQDRFKVLELRPFLQSTVEKVKSFARRREVAITVEGEDGPLYISMAPNILREVLEALLKNAVESTPDGGRILVRLENLSGRAWVHVVDTGIGITEENQGYVFDGLFHATETDLYSSKRPYEFGAGGKGLDLLKLTVYAKRFGFELTMTSNRCPHIPSDRDLCPGDVASCDHVQTDEECAASGGSTFSVAFPTSSRTDAP